MKGLVEEMILVQFVYFACSVHQLSGHKKSSHLAPQDLVGKFPAR